MIPAEVKVRVKAPRQQVDSLVLETDEDPSKLGKAWGRHKQPLNPGLLNVIHTSLG